MPAQLNSFKASKVWSTWLVLDQVVALDLYYDWGLLLSGVPLCLISY
jgi:hypothetical protein